jgi:hypothetical protein
MWRSSHRLACQKGLEMGDLKDNCHCNLGKMTPVDQFFFLQIHVIAMSCVIWRAQGAQALAGRLVSIQRF